MGKEVIINVIVKINDLGGIGQYDAIVDYQTAMLMMNSDIVTIRGRSYRVKYKEVDSSGKVNFYSEEVKREDLETLKISDIENG